MFFWNQTAQQLSSSTSLEKIPMKNHFNFMIYLQWSHAASWVSISFLSAPKQSTFHSILVQCHQFDIRPINPGLLESCFENRELPPVFEHLLCSMWFFNSYQQCFCHCICKFSVPGHPASGSGVLASFNDERCSSWHIRSKSAPVSNKDGRKTSGRHFFFLSSPGATEAYVWYSSPTLLCQPNSLLLDISFQQS